MPLVSRPCFSLLSRVVNETPCFGKRLPLPEYTSSRAIRKFHPAPPHPGNLCDTPLRYSYPAVVYRAGELPRAFQPPVYAARLNR